MIWLISLFLITVACYLIMQGLAERKLVQESHTDSTDVDEDLFMNISNRLNPEPLDGDMTIADEDSAFAKAVQSFQENSSKAGERIEKKIAESTDNPRESLYDRTLAKVASVSAKADEKLEQKIAASKQGTAGGSISEDDSQIGRIVTKVSETLQKSEEKFKQRVVRTHQIKAEKLTEEPGFFANAVNKVASRLESIDQRVDDKLAATRASNDEDRRLGSNGDLFSRVASKIGDRMNNVDDKIVDASRKLSDNQNRS